MDQETGLLINLFDFCQPILDVYCVLWPMRVLDFCSCQFMGLYKKNSMGLGCSCPAAITYGFQVLCSHESARHFHRFLYACREINPNWLRGWFLVLFTHLNYIGMASIALKKATWIGKIMSISKQNELLCSQQHRIF